MEKRERKVTINDYFFTKLVNYELLTGKERGELIETVAKHALNKLGCSYDSLGNKNIQYFLGDVLILSKNKKPVIADIKASHSFNGIDKVALDYRYYKKDSQEAYIPSNSNNNKGYIYHLNADSLICINPNSRKLYIVNKFQQLRENILNLVDDNGCTISELLDISVNRLDSFKDTKIINVAFEDMEQLGAEVISYQLDKENNNLYILENKKITSSVASTRAII